MSYIIMPTGINYSTGTEGFNYYSQFGYYTLTNASVTYSNSFGTTVSGVKMARLSPALCDEILGVSESSENTLAYFITIDGSQSFDYRQYVIGSTNAAHIRNSSTFIINGKDYVGRVSRDNTYNEYTLAIYGNYNIPAYDSAEEMLRDLGLLTSYSITYNDTNCTHMGPDEADVGDVVQVDYTFPDGYGIVNPSTDIYVTNNGVVVPSSYSNGILTFTMPDPS